MTRKSGSGEKRRPVDQSKVWRLGALEQRGIRVLTEEHDKEKKRREGTYWEKRVEREARICRPIKSEAPGGHVGGQRTRVTQRETR